MNTYLAFKAAVEAAFNSPAASPAVCFHPKTGWFTESKVHPNQGCLCRLEAFYNYANSGCRSVGDTPRDWGQVCETYEIELP